MSAASLNDIERARLNKISDSAKITPVELLRVLIDDIERGTLKCDALLVHAVQLPPDEWAVVSTYRCNMPHDRELNVLTLQQAACIKRWQGG